MNRRIEEIKKYVKNERGLFVGWIKYLIAEIERLEKELKVYKTPNNLLILHNRKLQRVCDCIEELDIDNLISHCKTTYEEKDEDEIERLLKLQRIIKESKK